ncbi:hypothetical protein PTKIN_Ptkin07bG0286300 [Pterospermum kingtungense]
MTAGVTYYLSQHPSIVVFRWSHTQSWGSTWIFLVTSIVLYLTVSSFLHLFLSLVFRRGRPIPLGPIPALHSLLMSVISAVIFAGILLSSAAEIKETRWFWRRSKTPFQWLLCFPLGTRPSGRVFFWSYAFYLSRFLHMFRTIFVIFRTLVSGPGDPVHDPGLLGGLRLQVLDRDRVTQSLFPLRFELPNPVAGLQPGLPCRGLDVAFHERWVQWDWSLGFELGLEWGYSVAVFEVLCSEQKKKTWETTS